MKALNQNALHEIDVTNYIRCRHSPDEFIIVGKLEDGRILLHVSDTDPPVPYGTLILPQDALFGLMASTMVYLKHYKIDFQEKIVEYFKGKPVEYRFTADTDEK